ncbi:MAG: M1 family aminopeptidase, partial [Planctomycetota bacterium]
WKEEIAMATYLITVVIGEFTAVTDKWDNLPLTYWVPPSAAPIARNTFGNTPLIMDFFCNAFGVRYPWPKYDQTIIWRFRYGGMENTSITNMTSHLLHDQVAHDDGENSDSIVAHEMAHQWFGDMVTMRSWPHLWLNEGFATYSESLWAEHNTGADSMMWRMDRNRGAFGWADNRNPEPIVRHNYGDPHQLFDGRTYQKGSWVLHMLRNQIGDEKFFETLRQYIEAYRGPDKNPVTNDFRRMAERVSGQDLGYFFTQWVYRGGWPKLDVSWKYEDGKAWVTVKQTQKVQDMWPLFAFPLMLGFVDAEGQETGHKVNVSRAEETFVLPMKVRPVRVRVDPGHRVLRELDMHQSDENWAEQLVYDADVVSRREALQHFNEVARGKDTSPEDRQRSCAMVLAAVDSPFAPLSEEAMDRVRSLVFDGKWVDDKGSPLAPLLHSWLTKNVHTVAVRAAALETLGRLSFAPAAGMIRELALNGDKKSYTMHAAALRAVAHLDADKALPTLRLALNFDSHRDEVRRAALDGICTHALEEGLELAAQFAQYGHGHHLRNHALDKLDDHLGDPAFEALFLRLLKDPDWRIRRRVAGSLGERAWSDHVIAVLDECAKTDPDPYPRDAMAGAANRLRERRKQAEAK